MKRKISAILVHAEIILMCIIVLVPITLVFLSAFNNSDSLAGFSLIPQEFTLNNFTRLFQTTRFGMWFLNTLKIAVTSAVCSVFAVMMTAWIMSRFDFRGRKVSLMTILILSMFPSFLSMVAIYTLFLILGLIGKHISLVIIYVAGSIPFNTWLVKGYIDGIPKSLDEAAYIDGCTKMQAFVMIILPMSLPIITYCAVSQFMMPWMDYILPNILISGDEQKTLAVGLYSLISRNEDAQFTMFAAGSVVIAVPITLLFMFFQKYLAQGIAAGANKG